MQVERRYVPASTAPVAMATRAGGQTTISGHAAVFFRADSPGTEYRLFEDAVERIREGAFDRALREAHDVRGLYNHNADSLLGRTSNGTCRISVDSTGLRYEVDVDPNDPDHKRVVAKINRGDLTGSSFAFLVTRATWEDPKGKPSIRWIEDLQLFDVGPVTYPAYEATTTGLRAEDGRAIVQKEFDAWKWSKSIDLKRRRLTLAKVK